MAIAWERATLPRMPKRRASRPEDKRVYPNRIHELRTAAGLSRRALAELHGGISGEGLRKIEVGERELKRPMMIALAKIFGVQPGDILLEQPPQGFAASEVAFVAEPNLSALELRQAALLCPGSQAATMLVKGRALELAGIVPGDRILVDLKRQPVYGDRVVAQVYDEQSADATTILRLFRPPALVTASADLSLASYGTGDNHVEIKGVIVARYWASIFDAP